MAKKSAKATTKAVALESVQDKMKALETAVVTGENQFNIIAFFHSQKSHLIKTM